ncbi:unnamed protein product, partial [Polarella glacialis]
MAWLLDTAAPAAFGCPGVQSGLRATRTPLHMSTNSCDSLSRALIRQHWHFGRAPARSLATAFGVPLVSLAALHLCRGSKLPRRPRRLRQAVAMASARCTAVAREVLKPLQTMVFRQSAGLESLATSGRNIFLVGKKEQLCIAAKKLAAVLGQPLIHKQAEALSANYAGAKAEAPWLFGDELRKVTLVALPEAAGRCVTPIRPDVIAKQLHGKIAGHSIVLAVGEDDVLAAGLAVARSLPPYTAKTEKLQEESVCDVSFFGCSPSEAVLQRLGVLAESVRVAQGLVDMPPNIVTPTSFKDCALEAVKDIPGVSHTVIEGEELCSRGYGLLWAVGKCAVSPPCLLVLTHRGSESSAEEQKGVALVGKGITFDTGGAALKSREGMCGMKRDMGGAAGTFGAFLALAKAGGLPNGRPLHCVLCLAENAIGSEMFLQDDILTAYSGLTVEINNTDAEGRLVLSDGVAHAAKHLNVSL